MVYERNSAQASICLPEVSTHLVHGSCNMSKQKGAVDNEHCEHYDGKNRNNRDGRAPSPLLVDSGVAPGSDGHAFGLRLKYEANVN